MLRALCRSGTALRVVARAGPMALTAPPARPFGAMCQAISKSRAFRPAGAFNKPCSLTSPKGEHGLKWR